MLTLSVTDGLGDTAFRTLTVNTTNPTSPSNTITEASGEIKNAGLIDVTGATTSLESDTLLNSGGTVKVEASAHLTLDDSRIYNGTITNLGMVEVIGIGSIASGAVLTNTAAQLTIDAASKLKLSNGTITGGTITDNGLIDVGGAGTINGGAQLSGGQVTVEAGQTLTLGSDTVTGTTFTDTAAGAILSVNGTDTLTLSGVTIVGGTINDGTVPSGATINITGSSEIENASFNNGGVSVAAGVTLTLDSDTVTGTTFTDTGILTVTGAGTTVATSSLNLGNSSATVTLSDGATFDATGAVTGTGGLTVAEATLEPATFRRLWRSSTLVGTGDFLLEPFTFAYHQKILPTRCKLDLTDLPYASGNKIVWMQNGSSGTLDIENSGGTLLESIALAGTYIRQLIALAPAAPAART